MSESETEKPKLGRKPLGLKRTVEAGQVQQSFSHGRKNTVVVEVKRRRLIGKPGEQVEVAAPPEPAPVQQAPAPAPQPAPPPARPSAPNNLMSRQELQAKLLREAEEARMNALEEARRREDAARQQAGEEERRRAEEKRKAEEEQGQQPDDAAVEAMESQ